MMVSTRNINNSCWWGWHILTCVWSRLTWISKAKRYLLWPNLVSFTMFNAVHCADHLWINYTIDITAKVLMDGNGLCWFSVASYCYYWMITALSAVCDLLRRILPVIDTGQVKQCYLYTWHWLMAPKYSRWTNYLINNWRRLRSETLDEFKYIIYEDKANLELLWRTLHRVTYLPIKDVQSDFWIMTWFSESSVHGGQIYRGITFLSLDARRHVFFWPSGPLVQG